MFGAFFEDKRVLPPITGPTPGEPGDDIKKWCTYDEWLADPSQCYNSFPPVKTETSSNITIWLLIGVILFILWRSK